MAIKKIELVKLAQLSGKKATIYTIRLNEDEHTLFHNFLIDSKDYAEELVEIRSKLIQIGNKTGARERFFTDKEGKMWGDGVVALHTQPKKVLRLYCIRNGMGNLILGNGGPKKVAAYQDDPTLDAKVNDICFVSRKLILALTEKEISYDLSGRDFSGNLVLDLDDFLD